MPASGHIIPGVAFTVQLSTDRLAAETEAGKPVAGMLEA
jgi:hypothetical protein